MTTDGSNTHVFLVEQDKSQFKREASRVAHRGYGFRGTTRPMEASDGILTNTVAAFGVSVCCAINNSVPWSVPRASRKHACRGLQPSCR